jgi:hypothetical protein
MPLDEMVQLPPLYLFLSLVHLAGIIHEGEAVDQMAVAWIEFLLSHLLLHSDMRGFSPPPPPPLLGPCCLVNLTICVVVCISLQGENLVVAGLQACNPSNPSTHHLPLSRINQVSMLSLMNVWKKLNINKI